MKKRKLRNLAVSGVQCHVDWATFSSGGLSWLIHLCKAAWNSMIVPLVCQTGVMFLLFKKGKTRLWSNLSRISTPQLPGMFLVRVLLGESVHWSNLRSRRNNLIFILVVEHMTNSFSSQGYHTCFVDLDKISLSVSSGIALVV